MKKVNFKDKFKKFSDQWSPKVIAELNDYQFKLVKIQNDFIWHKHIDTDEVFIVIEGEMFIEFKTDTIKLEACLLYTSPSPRDRLKSRMPSSA